MLLENLRDAIGHFDAGAGDEAIIIFLAEGGLCHLAPSERRRLLTAQEHGLNTGRRSAGRLESRPDVGYEGRNLRNLTDNHAVINLVAILEQRVLVHAVLLTRSRV